MGPAAVFDKSFLQSLSLDESVWFDHYFNPIITPLFFVETLADLEKQLNNARTPEAEVGTIANKTPEANGVPHVHHLTLCEGELHGYRFTTNGRPVIGGGKCAVNDGKKGFVFDISQEALALERWRNGEFLEVERLHAKAWRAALAEPKKQRGENFLRWHRSALAACKNLTHVRELARTIVADRTSPSYERMNFLFDVLGIGRDRTLIAARYEASGAPSLPEFAPYTAYVLEVEIFFHFACERSFISRERASNRVDIAYLNYLPFCQVFISNDNLHARTVPLFTGANQSFVSGNELKTDLAKINQLHSSVPSVEQELGILKFAPQPPTTGDFLTSKLWDKHLPRWRDPRLRVGPIPAEAQKKLIDGMKAMKQAAKSGDPVPSFSAGEINSLQLARRIRKKKGSWYQVPKDLPD